MSENYITVARTSDLAEESMKQVTVNDLEMLLVHHNGSFYAMGAHCTHYGAPLAKGALCGRHVICPWHHAWFDVTNGDLIEPPAFDALPRYEVKIEGDEVQVKVPEDTSDRRTPAMATCDAVADKRVFVILGGGAAGYTAAQTLREDGYRGRIIMITRETRMPYDRPNLSKDYMQGEAQPEWMPLRPEDFYQTYGIESMLNRSVKKVDHQRKQITFENGESLSYDTLLVATGGEPRQLKVPGADLQNVFLLRSFAQADEIIRRADDAKEAVVIGASFIGMETAASLQHRGIQVTVVAPDKVPFEKTLGPEIGKYFQHLHEKNGVRFKLGAGVKSIGGDRKAEAVTLESGEKINADLVIVGIGVMPVTGFLEGIDLEKDGGVRVDEHLQLAEGLYAAGDIAHVPDPHGNGYHRIEHWRYALQQGRTAAHNMAGKQVPFTAVPFFWTAHFGISLRYLGHAKGWDDIIYDGNPGEPPFLAFYTKDDHITAVAGIKRDTDVALLEQLFKDNTLPSAAALKEKGAKEAIPGMQGK